MSRFILILIMFVMASTARAAPQTLCPLEDWPYSAVIKSAPGTYEQETFALPPEVTAVRLEAKYLRFKSHDEWSPTYVIALHRTEDDLFGVRVTPSDDLKSLKVVTETRGESEAVRAQMPLGADLEDEWATVRVQIEWTRSGKVTAKLFVTPQGWDGAFIERTFTLGPPQDVRLIVSTADVDVRFVAFMRPCPKPAR